MTAETASDLPSWVPRHPHLPHHRAPLLSHPVAEDAHYWAAGPWKTAIATARATGWTVRVVVARGYVFSPTSPSDGLLDTFSLRLTRVRAQGGGATSHCAAVWERRTWPVLGRARKGSEGERQGEGRASTAGKTWLWHPPMTPPPVETVVGPKGQPVAKDPLTIPWKFDGAWHWAAGGPITRLDAQGFRNHLKAVPVTP